MIKSTFEPHLDLAREPDGEYTLNAVTLVPNGGYAAGRAERGVPPNVRMLPEVESVLLHLRHHGGPTHQALTLVRHHLADLKLGPSHGKTMLTAFVMIDNHVVGSASLDASSLGNVQPGHGKDALMPIGTLDWYAWLNRMPPGPASLHVTGIAIMPTPGYDVSLVEATPQGINPKDLILDLVISKKPGRWPQHVAQIPVRFDRSPAQVDYESVLVRLSDGSGTPIKVDTVF